MADDPSQGEAESPDTAEAPALSPTNIEALQELKAQEGNQAVREQGLRQLLRILDPHPNDHALTYQEVLGRLETVLVRERQAQGG